MDLFTRALVFAAAKHRDQRRKDAAATPYIAHPIGVAHRLAAHGIYDVYTLAAAALHDTLEDTDTGVITTSIAHSRSRSRSSESGLRS
jgi:guanosine-3',5'-bis(diphosphate) 3'-pyrophosphohydrolase